MHRVFISYHHQNDQNYKEELLRQYCVYKIFEDYSVDTGDISDYLDSQTIREKIRDEYLRNSTVTIVLVGTQTKNRKHVDWEIYSSMIDGKRNKKSGIIVVNLPVVDKSACQVGHEYEKETVHPQVTNWVTFTKAEIGLNFPFVPVRIADNLVKPEANMEVVPKIWTGN